MRWNWIECISDCNKITKHNVKCQSGSFVLQLRYKIKLDHIATEAHVTQKAAGGICPKTTKHNKRSG